jgi:hypothetical protein
MKGSANHGGLMCANPGLPPPQVCDLEPLGLFLTQPQCQFIAEQLGLLRVIGMKSCVRLSPRSAL